MVWPSFIGGANSAVVYRRLIRMIRAIDQLQQARQAIPAMAPFTNLDRHLNEARDLFTMEKLGVGWNSVTKGVTGAMLEGFANFSIHLQTQKVLTYPNYINARLDALRTKVTALLNDVAAMNEDDLDPEFRRFVSVSPARDLGCDRWLPVHGPRTAGGRREGDLR